MPGLTKKKIDAARHPDTGQRFLRDAALRGFAVRLTPGSKTFILEKEIHGRVRRLKLGRYGELTVDQARDLATIKLGEIAAGKDPAEERRRRRQSITFHELEQLYLERHAVHKKSKKNDVGMFNKWLADWRPRRLSTITRADITARHADMGAGGHTTHANRMVALVRTLFNLAFDWGVHPGPNPASRIKFFKEVKRDRFVRPDELPRLWKALQNEVNPYVRGAFFVGLLTGARRSEVLSMQWADLDLDQALWRIPDTKAGRPHTLPLPRPVVDELLKIPRLEGNPYVFCGRWGKKNLNNVSKPWRRIRKEAGIHDVRLHDLRRTLGSWMVAAGASLPLIGKTLNHSQPATTAIYARLELDPVREALEKNAKRMLTYAKKKS
ncbi:tyrosine-type recombinase/integrase [Nitrospira sp. BLG_2]|uniref:tyrosine-type recombinase/integrase n=1 Tax=Nitrospira sp. BLG_2 TaxID=3397507 RepID=UPI003B9CB688